MDKELKQELDWMNENLNTIAKNQAILYAELKDIEKRIPKPEQPDE